MVRPADAELQTLETAIRKQYKILAAILHDRQQSPRDDFVSTLLARNSTDVVLTHDMLINILELLIRAGYMTTIHSLTNIVLQLSRIP